MYGIAEAMFMAAYQQYFDDIVATVRWTMKRIYLLSLWLLACLVLPMKVKP